MRQITFEIKNKQYKLPTIMSIGDYVKIFKIKGFFEDEYYATKLINIITGADVSSLEEAPRDQITYLSNEILKLIPIERPTFSEKFTIDGVEYGFLPDWKKMTFAEYVDLDTLMTKPIDEMLNFLHIITAIMYRPITKYKGKHKFEIEKYSQDTLDDRAELFKEKLDVEVALGAQFFFIQFAQNYLVTTQISSVLPTMSKTKQIIFVIKNWRKIWRLVLRKDSVGMSFSTELLMMILQDTTSSLVKQSLKSSTSSVTWWKKIKNSIRKTKNLIKK